MEFEFDKEIDALLRQAAQRAETVSEAGVLHLDADEISAFAENALPQNARSRAVIHLADCASCRKFLSLLITLNAGAESEKFPLIEKKATIIPWYKRLFVFPQIAYATGALALVLSGIFAIAVLRNETQKGSREVAQVNEIPAFETPLPADSTSETNTNYSMSAANNSSAPQAASNSSIGAPVNARNKNSETVLPPNSNSSVAEPSESDKAAKPASKAVATANVSEEELNKKEKSASPVLASPKREDNYTVDGNADSAASKPQSEVSQNSVAETPAAAKPRAVQDLPMNGRSTQSLRMSSRAEMKASGSVAKDAKSDAEKTETRAAGGRNFRRADGIWYDVKYKGQKTINITRGSNEYKKLDGGLRSIADNLGGVIVVIWNDKAFRIQ